MVKILNESQIKRINTAIKTAGFMGRATEYGGSADLDKPKGCSVRIYFSDDLTNKMEAEVGHSSLGGRKISNMKASIENLQKCIKLANKIDKIIKG